MLLSVKASPDQDVDPGKKTLLIPIDVNDRDQMTNRAAANLIGFVQDSLKDGVPGAEMIVRLDDPSRRANRVERMKGASFLLIVRNFLVSSKAVDPDSVRFQAMNFR